MDEVQEPNQQYIPLLVAASLTLLTLIWFYLGHSNGGNNIPTYLLAVTILFWSALRRNSIQAIRESSVLSSSLLLLGYLALSGLWTPGWTWRALISLVGNTLLVTCFVVALVLSARHWSAGPATDLKRQGFLTWLTLILVCACFVSSSASLHLHYLFPDYRPLPEPSRLVAMGRLDNPVVASLAYGFALVLLLHLCLWKSRRAIPVWISLGLPAGFAIWLTETRGVYMGLGVALISLLLDRLGFRVDRTLLVALLLSLTVVATIFIAYPLLPWLLDWALPRGTSMRLEIWSTAIASISEQHLLFGKGQLDPGHLTYESLTFLHPHSLLVSTLYFGGLLGLTLLLLTMGITIRQLLLARHDEQRSLAIGLVTFSYSVLLLDGAEVLTKVDFLWLIFWLPVSITAVLELERKAASRGGAYPAKTQSR